MRKFDKLRSLRTEQDIRKDAIYATLNEEEQAICDLCCLEDRNVFVSCIGESGKNKVMKAIVNILSFYYHRHVLTCAPTFLSATTLEGTTIYKAFGLPSSICAELTPRGPQFISHPLTAIVDADVIVIDDISRVRMDTFSSIVKSIDAANKKRKTRTPAPKPIKLIVCGDFANLPPILKKEEKDDLDRIYGFDVKGGYAFLTQEWKDCRFVNFELTYNDYQEEELTNFLRSIRSGKETEIRWLKEHQNNQMMYEAPTLMQYDNQADTLNKASFDKLDHDKGWGESPIAASENGEYRALGFDEKLRAEKDALVAFTCDANPTADWFDEERNSESTKTRIEEKPLAVHKNGSVGVITDLNFFEFKGGQYIAVQVLDRDCEQNTLLYLKKKRHYLYQYGVNEKGRLKKEVYDYIDAFPIRLAYAISLTKGYGMTFDKCNLSPTWTDGAAYTALTRCRKMEGLHLLGGLKREMVVPREEVVEFYKGMEDEEKRKGEAIEMDELRFESSLSMEEIEDNFKDVDVFDGIMEGLEEVASGASEVVEQDEVESENKE